MAERSTTLRTEMRFVDANEAIDLAETMVRHFQSNQSTFAVLATDPLLAAAALIFVAAGGLAVTGVVDPFQHIADLALQMRNRNQPPKATKDPNHV